MGEKIDAYQIMTDRICALLEKGEIPWRRPWKASAGVMPSWLKKLRDDKSLLIKAAGQAQKAADLILGKSFDKGDE